MPGTRLIASERFTCGRSSWIARASTTSIAAGTSSPGRGRRVAVTTTSVRTSGVDTSCASAPDGPRQAAIAAALAFVVRDIHAAPRARVEVVDVEAVHVAAVQVQAYDGLCVLGNTGAMDVVGIRDEARDRARIEQEDAARPEVDLRIARFTVDAHVAALVERAAQHADDSPAAVVVDRGPLAGRPDKREEREVLLGRDVHGIARIVVRIGAEVLRLEQSLRLAHEAVHDGRDSFH